MTTLLKKAFDMASSLPALEQERLGAKWIADMKAGQFWRHLSESPQELPDLRLENRQLLESLNAAYNDTDMPDVEEQTFRRNMRRCHRRLIEENGQW